MAYELTMIRSLDKVTYQSYFIRRRNYFTLRLAYRTGGSSEEASMPVDVLVYCANGFVGQAIVHELLQAGLSVRAMVRDTAKASTLEQSGAHVVSAALEDDQALATAHQGARVALLQLPAGLEPVTQRRLASAAIRTIREAGVERVIYNAAVQIPRRAAELPTFAATGEIEDALEASTVPCTVIRPTFFLQNLLLPWVTTSIASHASLVYPIEPDCRLSWIAAEDVGRLAASVVQRDAYGHRISLGACEAVDGDELARAFSKTLDQHIEFVSMPVSRWEAQVDAVLGSGVGERVGAIFRFIQQHPDDLDFVSQTFTPLPFLPEFRPSSIIDWAQAHRGSYASSS
jgi:uncharacterized protein YbjT (DUF2867 family)